MVLDLNHRCGVGGMKPRQKDEVLVFKLVNNWQMRMVRLWLYFCLNFPSIGTNIFSDLNH